MPTIYINSGVMSVPSRRAIAVRLTRWFADRSVRPGHVVVRFGEDAANTVFSGGMPVDALHHSPDGLAQATVLCCVSPDRDEQFRRELATELAAALGMTEQTPFLHIEFRPTEPSLVYLASNGELTRADQVASVVVRGESS
ncbi:hypothetical protein [Nocardia sp. NPDC052566]|uniref:hypothetical protein n=1 Tax=Nocardia sp. NPDC052566 TaxID=3364330 RepID=UPI0037C54052